MLERVVTIVGNPLRRVLEAKLVSLMRSSSTVNEENVSLGFLMRVAPSGL